MALKTIVLLFFAMTCLVVVPKLATSQPSVLGRSYDRVSDELPNEVVSEPRKRPFCNAFTGCGRKRSSPPQEQILQEQKLRKFPMEESIESLLDLSSEPAVEDLSRQIMSEAKMWEAIQEAGAELMRRRQMNRNAYPLPLNLQ